MYLMMYMDTDTIHLTKFHVKVYQGVYLNLYDTLEYWKLKRKCIQVYINYFSPQRYINLNSVNSEKKCTQLYIDKSAYTLHLESPTNSVSRWIYTPSLVVYKKIELTMYKSYSLILFQITQKLVWGHSVHADYFLMYSLLDAYIRIWAPMRKT